MDDRDVINREISLINVAKNISNNCKGMFVYRTVSYTKTILFYQLYLNLYFIQYFTGEISFKKKPTNISSNCFKFSLKHSVYFLACRTFQNWHRALNIVRDWKVIAFAFLVIAAYICIDKFYISCILYTYRFRIQDRWKIIIYWTLEDRKIKIFKTSTFETKS